MTSETPEQKVQNAKFGYKAPESVYQKHDPKATLVGSGTSVDAIDDADTDVSRLWRRAQLTRIIFLVCVCVFRQGVHRSEPHGLLLATECGQKGGKGQGSRDQGWNLPTQHVQGKPVKSGMAGRNRIRWIVEGAQRYRFKKLHLEYV